eukprot:m.440636 g.440636  ORF g.440636 m.440636 type:complete len:398 (+) comp56795_c0_seq56:1351-2544(+)
MQPYFRAIYEERDQLLMELGLTVASLSDSTSVSATHQHMTFAQIQLSLEVRAASEADQLSVVEQLESRYQTAIAQVTERISSEVLAGDVYIILAVHRLVDLYSSSKQRKHLIKAIALVEKALIASPANAQLKLLGFRLHVINGSAYAGHKYWVACDVKNILFESIGFMAADHLFSLGAFELALELHANAEKFSRTGLREVSETLTKAFKFGTFGKILEILRFEQRLEVSYSGLLSSVEAVFFHLLRSPRAATAPILASAKTVSDEQLAKVSDNSDYTVIDSWTLQEDPIDASHGDGLKTLRELWLRFRVVTLRLLKANYAFSFEEMAALSSEYDKIVAESTRCVFFALLLLSLILCLFWSQAQLSRLSLWARFHSLLESTWLDLRSSGSTSAWTILS